VSDDLIRVAAIINPVKTKVAICKALGLDATKLVSAVITLDHGMPRVEMKMLLDGEMTEKLSGVLRSYNLVERGVDS
jgi:hypothetical protein